MRVLLETLTLAEQYKSKEALYNPRLHRKLGFLPFFLALSVRTQFLSVLDAVSIAFRGAKNTTTPINFLIIAQKHFKSAFFTASTKS
jgi:hypothetical protein